MEEEKIVLTLEDTDVKKEDEVKTEEKKEVVIDSKFNYDGLSDSEKKMVDDFSNKIDIENSLQTLQYGNAAQNKVADFSDNVLKNVKTKDLGETEKLITGLIKDLTFDEEPEGFLGKLFRKPVEKAKEMKDRYDSVKDNVDEIAKHLEEQQVILMKDIALLDQLYEKNQTNFKEISLYIIAGYKAIEKAKNETLPKLLAKANKTNLPEDAQKASDFNDSITRFEKRVHDLELTRVVALQTAPQIRMIQSNDMQIIEKIQSSIVNTIPLWKSQIVITLGLKNSEKALNAENEVNELTNKILKQNAEALKTGTVNVAKASERGIVDIETLTETNAKLIETLQEVKKIQAEGKEKRAQALSELRRIETELQSELKQIQK